MLSPYFIICFHISSKGYFGENNNIPKAVWRESTFPVDGAEEEPSLELSVSSPHGTCSFWDAPRSLSCPSHAGPDSSIFTHSVRPSYSANSLFEIWV